MAKLNHNRPYLKYVDNIMHEIAEMESWHKPEKCFVATAHESGVRKKTVILPLCSSGRNRPIREKDKKVHLLACSILNLMEQQRAKGTSANLANKLLEVLPQGIGKTALVDWFVAFGMLIYDYSTKKLCYNKEKTTQLVSAEAKPFWEFKPELEYKPFNLRKEIAALINIAIKRQQEIVEAKTKDALYETNDKIDPDRLKVLQAILALQAV